MIVIGIAEWCLPQRGPEAIYLAAQLELQAIHLEFQSPDNDGLLRDTSYIEACAKKAKELGIHIAALALNAVERIGGLRYPDTHKKADCINLIERGIEAAASVNIPLVYVPSFGLMEIRTESDFDESVQILKEASGYAKNKGVLLASENTLGSEGNIKLAHKISQPNFRILIDTLNPLLWGHSAAEIVSVVRAHMCSQIHAKDCSDSLLPMPLGSGIGQFAKTARTLQECGFDGIVIIENKYEQSRETNIRLDIANLRQYFAEESQSHS